MNPDSARPNDRCSPIEAERESITTRIAEVLAPETRIGRSLQPSTWARQFVWAIALSIISSERMTLSGLPRLMG